MAAGLALYYASADGRGFIKDQIRPLPLWRPNAGWQATIADYTQCMRASNVTWSRLPAEESAHLGQMARCKPSELKFFGFRLTGLISDL